MEDYSKYTKEELIEVITYLDKPIKSLSDVAVRICESLSCDNCPVNIFDCDRRTNYEKTMLHTPCCTQLYNWMLNEFRLIEGKC
jgi:hypothetical protein